MELIWSPGFIEELLTGDRQALRRRAEAILDKVEGDYGDVCNLNGTVVQQETLAAVAAANATPCGPWPSASPHLEIEGTDIEGKPMKLSSSARPARCTPGLRQPRALRRLPPHPPGGDPPVHAEERPFVILGINNNDRRRP
ncbi:MAG: hypothetical protein U0790_24100 [Isosphaeraceae bacterium]